MSEFNTPKIVRYPTVQQIKDAVEVALELNPGNTEEVGGLAHDIASGAIDSEEVQKQRVAGGFVRLTMSKQPSYFDDY